MSKARKKQTKYKVIVVSEVHNGGTFVEQIVSDTPISIDRIANYYEIGEGYNWDKDNIVTFDPAEILTIDLDNWEKENAIPSNDSKSH